MRRVTRLLGFVTVIVAVAAVLVVIVGRSDGERVSVRRVEQALREQGRMDKAPFHEIECVRDRDLPRSFNCFVETADQIHLALEVHLLRNGRLVVRPP